MGLNKRLLIGGAAEEAFDPLKNFETVTYTGNGGTQKITGYIRKGAAFGTGTSKITLPQTYGAEGEQFSYSLWFNTSSADGSYMFAKRVGNNTFHIRIDNSFSPAGKICVNNWIGTAQAANNAQSTSGGYNDGSWHHFVFTYDGARTPKTQCYIDGVRDTGMNWDYDLITQSGYQNNIGNYDLNNQNFSGKIDQVRIFDKALSSAEVTTLYNEDYDSSTKSTTDIFGDSSGVALYELDEDAKDTGVPIDSGQSAAFNGSNSYIDVPTIPNITGSGSDFSFSAWINFDGTSGDRFIMSFRENSYIELGFNSGYSPRKLEFKVNDGANKTVLVNESDITNNTWHHVCLTAESSGNLTAYLDGVSKGTTAIGSIGNAGQQNSIGAYNTGTAAGHFSGKIDQVRIYNTALSSGDVTNLFNESNVPSSGLVAHYKLDGDAIDEQGSYDGTASNVTYSDPALLTAYNGTPTNVNFLGMAFQPDLVWLKSRTNPSNGIYHTLMDSVRGQSSGFYKSLFSNSADQEDIINGSAYTQAVNGGVSSFDTNGFTLSNGSGASNDDLNVSSYSYVAWCWKAGGAAVSNTDGSITSSVSANPDAGFSIVKYTGESAARTVGHGLSAAPEMVIIKNLDDARNWMVYHKDLSASSYLRLNLTNAEETDTRINEGQPRPFGPFTSTTFGVNIDNETGHTDDYIAYLFHSVDSYQKVGSYTGNRPTDVSVNVGFAPRFVMIKCNAAGEDWLIVDSTRGNFSLYPNSSAVEDAYTGVSLTSTGFTVHDSGLSNTNGATHIYLAIA